VFCHIRKFRVKLQAVVSSPRALSLVLSLEGTIMLNAELYEQRSHIGEPLVQIRYGCVRTDGNVIFRGYVGAVGTFLWVK
jgi:hypothetical protein